MCKACGKNREGVGENMNPEELIKKIEGGELDARLKALYVDENLVPCQKKRILGSIEKFMEIFKGGSVSLFSSPGRTEISGNHTDHQHGMAIAAAVNMDVLCVASRREDPKVCVISEGYEPFFVDTENLKFAQAEKGTTTALIKGILKGMMEEGRKIGGFNCYMTSTVLQGSGLSSSAAFENALGTIVNHFFNDAEISPTEIAKISKFAENVYFGKPSGLLDQIASSTGGLIKIDFKDPENPEVEKINVDFEDFGTSLCIVDTGGSHADLTDEYAAIPREMRSVCEFFGKTHLRSVDVEEFYRNMGGLREKCTDRAILRALHFFNEEENVLKAKESLESGNFQAFLHFIKASGNSSYKFLQNIYATKQPENQNISLALAVSDHILHTEKGAEGRKGVCRVHGGGFAGTIQAFVQNDFVDAYRSQIEEVFKKGSCHILKIRNEGSVKII